MAQAIGFREAIQTGDKFSVGLRPEATHWTTHNKKFVRLLENNGELEQRLNDTAARAIFIQNQAEGKGLAPDQARELAYDCLLLPED
jgi:hypothetical protein